MIVFFAVIIQIFDAHFYHNLQQGISVENIALRFGFAVLKHE